MTVLDLLLDSRTKKSSNTRMRKRRDKSFRFELLEPRQLLSCGGTAVDADTLDPLSVHKYVNALPNPLDPSFIYAASSTVGKTPRYDIGVYQTAQDLLGPVDVKAADGSVIGTATYVTDVYGYGTSQATATYPGRTFEVKQNQPIQVHWTNGLGSLDNYLLKDYVDDTIMMAMPEDGRIPIVTHVHGGHTDAAYDGTPEQWFTDTQPGDVGPDFVTDTYTYSNDQRAATIWYHDHALGYTRLNVYAGMAGFYIVRDNIDTGKTDNLAGLPSGPYEIPLAIQDRSFTCDGQLYYPTQQDPSGATRMLPEAFGDVMLVNGKAWPVLHVEPRAYRFRLLNGCDSRFLNVWLAQESDATMTSNPVMTQVGTDQGLLSRPVAMQSLLFGPGEREDIVVDFSKFAPGTKIIMRNDAATPYASGDPVDPNTTGQIMEFIVDIPLNKKYDNPKLKTQLVPPIKTLKQDGPTRQLGLFETETTETFTTPDGPADFTVITPMLGTLAGGPVGYCDPITEVINLNDTEVWEIYNTTADVHPVHLHLVSFQLLSRQDYVVTTETGAPIYTLSGSPVGPNANEVGWKDTVLAYPGQVTRITAKFDKVGEYVWHCHILSHEEHDMMRPFLVQTPAAPALAAATVPATTNTMISPAVVETTTDVAKPIAAAPATPAKAIDLAILYQALAVQQPPNEMTITEIARRKKTDDVDQVFSDGWFLPLDWRLV
jgi:spore coat protein A, manganese oxidase